MRRLVTIRIAAARTRMEPPTQKIVVPMLPVLDNVWKRGNDGPRGNADKTLPVEMTSRKALEWRLRVWYNSSNKPLTNRRRARR